MTAVTHPSLTGVTVETHGEVIHLTIEADDAAVLVVLHEVSAQALADLLVAFARIARDGWTSNEGPPSSEAVTAPSAATSPESQAS